MRFLALIHVPCCVLVLHLEIEFSCQAIMKERSIFLCQDFLVLPVAFSKGALQNLLDYRVSKGTLQNLLDHGGICQSACADYYILPFHGFVSIYTLLVDICFA